MKTFSMIAASLLITLITYIVPSPVLPIFRSSFFYYSYFESDQIPTDKGYGLPLAYISENTCASQNIKPPEGSFAIPCPARYSLLGSHSYSVIFFAVDIIFWYLLIRFTGKFLKKLHG